MSDLADSIPSTSSRSSARRARIDAATEALAARWYGFGASGPTGHGWMRQLAEAALEGADSA